MKTQKEGLPQHLFDYVSSIVPMINIDILLITKRKKSFPLIWRDDGMYGPGWHIPGGIIRFKEEAKERIEKTIEKEIGITSGFEYDLVEINEIMNHSRDKRGHFISLLYKSYIDDDCGDNVNNEMIGDRDKSVRWFTKIPDNMIMQHKRYEKAINEAISEINCGYKNINGNLV